MPLERRPFLERLNDPEAEPHPRPFRTFGLVPRTLPFVGVFVLTVVSFFLPETPINWSLLWPTLVFYVLLIGSIYVTPWDSLRSRWQPTIPWLYTLGLIPLSVALEGQGGVAPLVLLGVVWIAVYGTPQEVVVVVVLIFVRFYVPIAFDLPNGSAPDVTYYRNMFIWTAVAGVVGVIVNGETWTRRLAERKSEEDAQLVHNIIENAVGAYVVIDVDGVVQEWSQKAQSLFGFSPSEVVGNDSFGFMSPPEQDPIAARQELLRMARGERQFDEHSGGVIERRIKCKNGTLLPVYISGSVQTTVERGFLVHLFFYDASEETAIKAEMIRSNEDLENLSRAAAHDLKAPLRHMVSFAKLLDESAGSKLDVRERDMLNRIHDSGRRAGMMIDGLMEYSRIGRDTRIEDVQLREAVDEALALIGDPLPVTVPHSIGCVRATNAELVAVFKNLLENSSTYRDENRRLSIVITCESTEKGLRITLADNGIGIPVEYAERVFEPFKRLHSPDKYPGSGLGLSLCRRVVNGLGGSIRAEPNTPFGTRIVMEFPTAALCKTKS